MQQIAQFFGIEFFAGNCSTHPHAPNALIKSAFLMGRFCRVDSIEFSVK
jgi:hypothetical protein